MSIVAMMSLSCPKMMSLASSWISVSFMPSSRSAAFCITPGSTDTPTVKRDGTSIRMFCLDSAFFKSTGMEIGVKSRYSYAWMTGMINAAPPWMHFALREVPSLLEPILPYTTRILSDGHFLYRDKRTMRVVNNKTTITQIRIIMAGSIVKFPLCFDWIVP